MQSTTDKKNFHLGGLAHVLDLPGGGESDCLQKGSKLVAAGYALYSSATMLVVSWGQGVHGFTLDTAAGDFVLTHPYMRIPQRGEDFVLTHPYMRIARE